MKIEHIKKRIIKYGLILVALCFLGLLGNNIYVQSPSEVDLQLTEGPSKMLAEFVAIAEKGVPINPDPYAASTYRPDDVLYNAMHHVQIGYRYDAQDIFEKLAEQGNVDAMFWMGALLYRVGIGRRASGAGYFLKAAELGNPYAALMLDDNYVCLKYMKGYCDAKWGEQGRKILRERAAQGDAKAGYALYLNLQYNKPSFAYYFNRDEYIAEGRGPFQVLIKAAKDGIKQHYYKPLNTLIRLSKYNASKLTTKDKVALNKVLEIGIHNNDVRSVMSQYRHPELFGQPSTETIDRLLPFFPSNLKFFVNETYASMAHKNRAYAIRGYAQAIMYEESPVNDRDYIGSYVYRLGRQKVSLLSEKEKAQARVLADEYLKAYSPILTFDETRTR